jgi:hypothetical protein
MDLNHRCNIKQAWSTPLYQCPFSAELIDKAYEQGAWDLYDICYRYFNQHYLTRYDLGELAFSELSEWIAFMQMDEERFLQIEYLFIERIDISELLTPTKRPRIRKK